MTAERLIKEHSMANSQLKQVARKKGVNLPNTPNARQKAIYNRLARLSGVSFDKAYMGAQIRSHLNSVSLYQNQIRAGKDADATLYARETLPIVQDHLTMIVSVAQNVGVRIPKAADPYKKVQTSTGGHAGGQTGGQTSGQP